MKQMAIPYEAKFGAIATTQESLRRKSIWLEMILLSSWMNPQPLRVIWNFHPQYSSPYQNVPQVVEILNSNNFESTLIEDKNKD